MSATEGDLYFLRFVIQQLSASENPGYRIVVYGDSQPPRHADVSSAQILLVTLRAAMPNLDLSKLSLNPLATRQGSIVYTGKIELNRAQLSLLRLS